MYFNVMWGLSFLSWATFQVQRCLSWLAKYDAKQASHDSKIKSFRRPKKPSRDEFTINGLRPQIELSITCKLHLPPLSRGLIHKINYITTCPLCFAAECNLPVFCIWLQLSMWKSITHISKWQLAGTDGRAAKIRLADGDCGKRINAPHQLIQEAGEEGEREREEQEWID